MLGSRVDAQDPEQVRRRNTVRASNAEHWARELTSARQLVRRGTAKTKCPRCGGDIDDAEDWSSPPAFPWTGPPPPGVQLLKKEDRSQA